MNKKIIKVVLVSSERTSLALSILFLMISFSLVVYTYFEITNGLNSVKWPISQGKIIASSVEAPRGDDSSYSPKVQYQYRVNGKEYLGRRISFVHISGLESWAEHVISMYPMGKNVQVFYKTDNPQVSVLEPTKSLGLMLSVKLLNIILAIIFLIPAIILWLYRKSRNVSVGDR